MWKILLRPHKASLLLVNDLLNWTTFSVVANSRGPRTAGRGAKYRGLPVRGPKSNSRGPRTSF